MRSVQGGACSRRCATHASFDAAITNRIAFDSSSDFLQRPRLRCRRRMRCAQHWSGAYPIISALNASGAGMRTWRGPDVGQKKVRACLLEEISADSRYLPRDPCSSMKWLRHACGRAPSIGAWTVMCRRRAVPRVPCGGGVVAPPMAQPRKSSAQPLNRGPHGALRWSTPV